MPDIVSDIFPSDKHNLGSTLQDLTSFRLLIEKLIYLINGRLDISFDV